MRDRQSDVLVEMEGLDPFPVDTRLFGERAKKLQLRGRSRRDNASAPAFRDGVANRARGLIGRGMAQGNFVAEYSKKHVDASKEERRELLPIRISNYTEDAQRRRMRE